MADPVITDHFRVLAVWERASGLPEDRIVNSWVWRNDTAFSPPETFADRVRDILDDFYNDAAPTFSIKSFMSPELQSLTYRVYDLGQPPPREPLIRPSIDWTQPSGTAMAAEVALCMSFYADRNLPRRRGRLFLGPLNQSAGVTTAGVLRPNVNFRNTIANRAKDMINRTGGGQGTWTVLSGADADVKVITNGWIDDAFDTQRRRGWSATERTLFSSSVP